MREEGKAAYIKCTTFFTGTPASIATIREYADLKEFLKEGQQSISELLLLSPEIANKTINIMKKFSIQKTDDRETIVKNFLAIGADFESGVLPLMQAELALDDI